VESGRFRGSYGERVRSDESVALVKSKMSQNVREIFAGVVVLAAAGVEKVLRFLD
jgi:hypothetical protein